MQAGTVTTVAIVKMREVKHYRPLADMKKALGKNI
jgi:hypothetical protein